MIGDQSYDLVCIPDNIENTFSGRSPDEHRLTSFKFLIIAFPLNEFCAHDIILSVLYGHLNIFAF